MIYILHIDPPLAHARHYVGFTEDDDVARRVNEHINQTGRRPSKLVGAALRAGCAVTLVGTMPGDRTRERRLKDGGSASKYCPLCKPAFNVRKAAQEKARRAARKAARA
jgi:hypothetical protein